MFDNSMLADDGAREEDKASPKVARCRPPRLAWDDKCPANTGADSFALVWLLGRSRVRALRTGEDLASIRQRDAVGVGGVATVLSQKTLDGDLVSLFQ